MVNINKLKGKMVEKGLNAEFLASKIGIDRATLYRRFNGNGEDFSIKEADIISETLELSLNEVNCIFFSQFVAETHKNKKTEREERDGKIQFETK